MKYRSIVLFGLIIILATACKKDTTSSSGQSSSSSNKTSEFCANLPDFSRDSAYLFIEKQLAFGPRVPGSKAHEQCANWMIRKLKSYGHEVKLQKFDAKVYTGQTYTGKNIIAVINPDQRKRIMLSAHWDSRPFSDAEDDESLHDVGVPAANDGASGVAVLLEIARLMEKTDMPIGVDIVLFDLEDHGDSESQTRESVLTWALGSQYWAQNRHEPGYRPEFGILLDMVGAKDARFPKEGVSRQYASDIVDKVWNVAKLLGYNDLFVDEDGPSVTDDHGPVNRAGIKMIDIIHLNQSGDSIFFPHWHKTTDDMDQIDRRTLGAVGTVVMNVLCRSAGDSF